MIQFYQGFSMTSVADSVHSAVKTFALGVSPRNSLGRKLFRKETSALLNTSLSSREF